MSCDKKKHEHHAKDGHDGKRGERGKRGHHGPIGFPGDTGPTGPCCTGPTGTAAPCTDLFTQITENTCTEIFDDFVTIGDGNAAPLCVCFNLQPNAAMVRIFVSLSADLTTDQQVTPSKQVFYQVTDNGVVIFGSRAGFQDDGPAESKAGNAIILQVPLAPGQHVICVQWRVGAEGQHACIDPNDATCGMHASLLIEGCDGMTLCPPP